MLLVSPDFLFSDFIADHELPPLLKAAEDDGLAIVWIPVSASSYEETEIAVYQAAHDPAKPLDCLDAVEQNRALVEICKKIKAAVDPSARSSQRPAVHAARRESSAPKISTSHLPPAGKCFIGRDRELAQLTSAWEDPATNIVQFVAFGGVGKSALVEHWLKQMQGDDWGGATRVFGYSFHSQGSRDESRTSADSFLSQALAWFGDDAAEVGSPWDRGERLAQLVLAGRV